MNGSKFRSHQIAEMMKENRISIKRSGFIWNVLRFTTQIRFHPFWLEILRLCYKSKFPSAINISLKARTQSAYNLLRHTVRMREVEEAFYSACLTQTISHEIHLSHATAYGIYTKFRSKISPRTRVCRSRTQQISVDLVACAIAMVIFSWLFISSISQSDHTIQWINQWVKALNRKSIFSK